MIDWTHTLPVVFLGGLGPAFAAETRLTDPRLKLQTWLVAGVQREAAEFWADEGVLFEFALSETPPADDHPAPGAPACPR